MVLGIEMGKKKKQRGGRPRGSYDGPRKEDTILRRYWRLRSRAYRAKKRGDLERFHEAMRRLEKLEKKVTK